MWTRIFELLVFLSSHVIIDRKEVKVETVSYQRQIQEQDPSQVGGDVVKDTIKTKKE